MYSEDSRHRGSRAATDRHALLMNQLTGRRGPAPGLVRDRRAMDDRRRQSAWSFLYGGVRPRRRSERRTEDEQRILLDWHEPRILYLALAILLMSCADALFTLNLLAAGGEELNALMRAFLGQGIRWFLWAKIGLTGFSVVVLVMVARHRLLGRVSVIYLLQLFLAGYTMLIAWELYLLGWQASAIGSDAVDEFYRRLIG